MNAWLYKLIGKIEQIIFLKFIPLDIWNINLLFFFIFRKNEEKLLRKEKKKKEKEMRNKIQFCDV